MIRKPNNWNNVTAARERRKLPVDGYVCRIKQAVVQTVGRNNNEQLCVLFDICEGDYIGYFDSEYKNNTFENKKWKGVLRIWLPKDDGSENDERTKSFFKAFVEAVEASNTGYVWNWDERSLKGKTIGVIMRNEEWEYNGKHGWRVAPFKAAVAEDIRNGDFQIPKEKPLAKKDSYSGFDDSFDDVPTTSVSTSSGFELIEEEDSELPF